MLLLLFGLYAILAGKLQISKHYGLKGTPARFGGVICIACSLGFLSIFDEPILAITRALNFGDQNTFFVASVLQILVLLTTLVVLVRIYGNGYAKSPKLPPEQ